MSRSGFLWIKHLCYAVVALAMIVCLAEIGLRVYDSATGQVTRCRLYDQGLTCKSWFVHHTLRPAQVFSVKHPDRDERIRLAVNSFGFRGREPQIPRPTGVYRVVCLGDDQTFGQALPLEETFPHRLAELWREQSPVKIDAINAAVPGYCPLLMYLQFKLQFQSLSPDLVVVQIDPSDIAEDYACRRQLITSADRLPLSCAHPDLRMKRGEGQKAPSPWLLPEMLKQHGAALWAEKMLTEPSRSIDSPQGRYAWLEDEPPDWSVYIAQALEPLALLQALCDAAECDFVVVAIPAPWQVSATASAGGNVREQAGVGPQAEYRGDGPAQLLREFADKHGIALVDLTATFRKQTEGDSLFWNNAAQISDRGHELVARALARRLAPLLPGAGRESNRREPLDSTEEDDAPSESAAPTETTPLARRPRPEGMARTESATRSE
jgi:hypothetical protein